MQVQANGIAIEVEVHGASDAEPLLLIMGLGMQLVGWPLGLVEHLVARGFQVIRFDNRDIGLSQHFDGAGVPSLPLQFVRQIAGKPLQVPYGLSDMAADAVGVLDAMGIRSAHVCGASMGGMIAQRLALDHADRVRSLCLMMTTARPPSFLGPRLKVLRAMLAKPPASGDIERVVHHYMQLFRVIGSPGYPAPEAALRAQIEMAVRRSYHPEGSARQLFAMGADGDRSRMLGRISQPVRIIHGVDDPLLRIGEGRQIARAIPGSRLDEVPGMGHDLPEALWPRFADGIRQVATLAASSGA